MKTTVSQAALGYTLVGIGGWGALSGLFPHALDISQTTGMLPGPFERSVIAGHIMLLRGAPWLLTPLILAPAAIAWFWLYRQWRDAKEGPSEASGARPQLASWLAWLHVAIGAAAFAGLCWAAVGIRPSAAVLVGLLVMYLWSYSGALYHALALHRLRLERGSTRVPMSLLAAGAVVAQALGFGLFGSAIPIWVFWTSRTETATGAAHV